MRRYTITVNDTAYVIDVVALSAENYRVDIEGRSIDVRLDDHSDLAHAQISPSVEVHARGLAPAPPPVADPTARPAVAAKAPTPRPAAVAPAAAAPATGAPAPSSANTLTAPMPGVILSIVAPAGTPVSRGDTVLVLEAMKMKNTLKSPRDAVVGQILVSEGQQVRYGDPLATFEDAQG